jgi:hypothetical protein
VRDCELRRLRFSLIAKNVHIGNLLLFICDDIQQYNETFRFYKF